MTVEILNAGGAIRVIPIPLNAASFTTIGGGTWTSVALNDQFYWRSGSLIGYALDMATSVITGTPQALVIALPFTNGPHSMFGLMKPVSVGGILSSTRFDASTSSLQFRLFGGALWPASADFGCHCQFVIRTN